MGTFDYKKIERLLEANIPPIPFLSNPIPFPLGPNSSVTSPLSPYPPVPHSSVIPPFPFLSHLPHSSLRTSGQARFMEDDVLYLFLKF